MKQAAIRRNNRRENDKRIAHEYRAGDQVLFKSREDKAKFGKDPWEGPYTVVAVNNDNGTVRLRKGAVIETINFRLIKPYKA